VNTIWPSTLPARTTPFEVWFGWKLHWLNVQQLNVSNNLIDSNENKLPQPALESNNKEDIIETDIEAEEYILTELEYHIRQNNTGVAARMVKKAGKKTRVFKKSWLVTLAIPSKLRLHTEPKCLLCQIVKVTKNQYFLDSTKGPISRSHSALQLNLVESADQSWIPIAWPAGIPKLTINKAVQLINNRGTIASTQRAARLANRQAKPVQHLRQQSCKHKEAPVQSKDVPEQEPTGWWVSRRKRQKRTGVFSYSG
jgi:hypothetical protein